MKLPFGFEVTRKQDGHVYLRKPARRVLPQADARFFSGAQGGDLTFSWAKTDAPIDQLLGVSLGALRARSRDLVVNNDHGAKFIKLVKGQVVGPHGIKLQAKAQDFDGKPDNLANQEIERAWREWGQPGACSMDGRLSWVDLQELFIGGMAEDGEVIFLIVEGKDAGPLGFALHPVDPTTLDTRLNMDLKNGNLIRLGVEQDKWGRPLAYHFRAANKTLSGAGAVTGADTFRVPADRIIHKFLIERVGQNRGLPWMTPSMLRMKMLGAFEEAALVNARVGAAKVGVITTPTGDSFVGDGADPVTGDQLVDADPGTFIHLAEGQAIDAWDPAYPNGEFASFSKAVLQSISSGLGVDYAGLTSDLEGVNYSSIRAGLVETRQSWIRLQEMTIRHFCLPVFKRWLRIALATGQLKVMGSPLPVSKETKFQRVTHVARRWDWVDPLKDIQAAKLAIDEGLTSRSAVISEHGKDPDEVWEEIKQEREKLAALGFSQEKVTESTGAK